MKISLSILAVFLLLSVGNPIGETKVLLDGALEANEVSEAEYEIFAHQIAKRQDWGVNARIDSMGLWGLDILYLEEEYDISNQTFLIKEYYFSSIQEDSLSRLKPKEDWRIYRPDRYYENGTLTKRYFFRHYKAKEQLESIRLHMSNRKLVDNIHAIVKEAVIHAGCGFSGIAVQNKRDKVEKKYRKPRTPKHYLIESLLDSTEFKVSFQIPKKQKYEVIVEGYSF